MNEQDRKTWMELGEILEPIAMRGWLAVVFFDAYPTEGERIVEFSLSSLGKNGCKEVDSNDDSIPDIEYGSDSGAILGNAREMVKLAMKREAE